jgi:transposase
MTRSAKGTVEEPGKNVRAKAGLNRSLLEGGLAGLIQKIAYKAERDGSRLIKVDPRYTSQTCSKCGVVDVRNRRDQSHFVCVGYGHTANADENAAKNILARALSAAQSGFAATAADAGRSVRAGRNGGVGRRVPRNTANISLPDDGGGMPSQHLHTGKVSQRGLQVSGIKR